MRKTLNKNRVFQLKKSVFGGYGFFVSLGIIFVSLAIWLLCDYNVDMKKQLNDDGVGNVILVENNAVDANNIFILGEKSKAYFEENNGRQLTLSQRKELEVKEEEISWIVLAFNVEQEGLELTVDGNKIQGEKDIRCKFIKNSENGTHPQSIENFLQNYYGHGVIEGDGFSKAKNELYISERLLEDWGVEAEGAIGKTVSLSADYTNYNYARHGEALDNDCIYDNPHSNYTSLSDLPSAGGRVKLFIDYKIVGVISNDYYNVLPGAYNDADIWIKYGSLVTQSGVNLLPKVSYQDLYMESAEEKEEALVLTYPTVDHAEFSQSVTEEGCFYPFILAGARGLYYNRGHNNLVMPMEYSFVQCENIAAQQAYLKVTDGFLKENNVKNMTGWYSFDNSAMNSFTNWVVTPVNVVSSILLVLGVAALSYATIKSARYWRRTEAGLKVTSYWLASLPWIVCSLIVFVIAAVLTRLFVVISLGSQPVLAVLGVTLWHGFIVFIAAVILLLMIHSLLLIYNIKRNNKAECH